MLTPDKMNELQKNRVVELYTQINQELTNEIIKKIKLNGDITDLTKSQIKTLIANGGQEVFINALKKIQGISRKTMIELNILFNELINLQMEGYKKTYEKVGVSYGITASMLQIINSAIKRTGGTLSNMTKTIAYASKTSFVKAMDDLYVNVVSGVSDYSSAIKKTVTDLAKKGITFTTSDGREEQIETVVKRSMFSSLHDTANDIAKEIGKEIDYNCVVIGHSYTCRPKHHPIDDVVMSKELFKKYEYLTKEYGCNHIVNYDWREEFDEVDDKVEYGEEHGTLEEVEENYEIRQKANYYANKVRHKKRQIANGDNSTKVKKELRNAQAKYRMFCNSNGLTVDYSKTWTAGYNKIQVSQNWFDNLNSVEKRSINNYFSSNSYKINEALYTKRALTTTEKTTINNLDKALQSVPKYNGYVNRSIEVKNQQQLNNILSIFNNKEKIGYWESYVSSSKEIYDSNMKLQLKIKSINGRDLSILNDEGGGEVLFERKTKFKYIDSYKKDGKIYVELEEVE